MFTEEFNDIAGQTLYAYPASNFVTNDDRVLCIELDSGVYSATLDETIDRRWLIFIGAATPSDPLQAIYAIEYDDLTQIIDKLSALSITIAPGVLTQQRRDDYQLHIDCYVGETVEVTRFVFDSNDPPQSIDLRGMSLQLVIETKSKVPVVVIESSDITIVGEDHNGFQFDLPAVATETARVLECSLRNLNDGKRVWGRGAINVRYAPIAQE
jgi:hypothetical protein